MLIGVVRIFAASMPTDYYYPTLLVIIGGAMMIAVRKK